MMRRNEDFKNPLLCADCLVCQHTKHLFPSAISSVISAPIRYLLNVRGRFFRMGNTNRENIRLSTLTLVDNFAYITTVNTAVKL